MSKGHTTCTSVSRLLREAASKHTEDERKEAMSRLYYHKTDGGAEYLCSSRVPGTEEGAFDAAYIVRLDGTPELVRTPAPELLAAGEALLSECVLYRIQLGFEEMSSASMDKARAAIEKARKGELEGMP